MKDSEEPCVQNLSVCIALMSLSGLLRVAATMILAFPDYRSEQRSLGSLGQQEHECPSPAEEAQVNTTAITATIATSDDNNNRLRVAFHILLLTIAAGVSVMGSCYGPVSIAVPVQTASQLFFNVIAMGLVLRMRAFTKAERTGTYVVLFSVLSLMDVGPGLQNGQNVQKLLSNVSAFLWCLFVTLCLILAAAATFPLVTARGSASSSVSFAQPRSDTESTNWQAMAQRCSFVTLTVGVTMSNVGMATAGKMLGTVRGPVWVATAVYYVMASLLGVVFSVTSATRCDQGLFTPLSSVALLLVNMLTGIVVWEDWKVMHTWIGYICACLLMCCGVYLLAEIDLLEEFWNGKMAAMVTESEECSDFVAASNGSHHSVDDIALAASLLDKDTHGSLSFASRIPKDDAQVWHDCLVTPSRS